MKIESMNGPSTPNPAGTQAIPAQSAVQRAVAKLEALQNAQSAPVQNPTSVSPEEMGAIRAPSQRQNGNNESPAPEAPVESKVSEEPLSSQYATLARQTKALRLRDQQLKQREAALRSQEEASKAKAAPAPAPSIDESKYIPRDRLMKDPIRTLLDAGFTYEQLTEAALNGPKQEDIALQNEMRALRDELKALKGETESTKKSFEENQTAQRVQAERQIRADVARLVQSDPQFETVKATKSIGDVVELITKTFDEDGILLTVDEAAQQVEDYLIDEALKLSKINKIQQRLQRSAAPAASAPQKASSQPSSNQMRTLTNSVSSSRPLSAKERAVLAFQGKLNK